jgi:catechol 2,3-dioxygenase-like lactoylglutathione lyase family enzyme
MAPVVAEDSLALSACLSVADLDVSIRWYQLLLGLDPVDAATLPAIGTRVAYLSRGNLHLELAQTAGSLAGTARPDPPEHTTARGITQITVYVRDIDVVLTRCTAAGVEVAMAPVRAPQLHVAAFFVRDPDGNLIEFIQRTEVES